MEQKSIKRFWIVAACLLVLEAVGLGVAMNWQRLFPPREVSELYKRYAGCEGLEVSFVKGLRLNDSTHVDVTLLVARDDSAWAALSREFDLMPPTPQMLHLMAQNKINPIGFRLGPAESPEVPLTLTTGNIESEFASGRVDRVAMLVIDHMKQSIAILEIDNVAQLKAVSEKEINERYN